MTTNTALIMDVITPGRISIITPSPNQLSRKKNGRSARARPPDPPGSDMPCREYVQAEQKKTMVHRSYLSLDSPEGASVRNSTKVDLTITVHVDVPVATTSKQAPVKTCTRSLDLEEMTRDKQRVPRACLVDEGSEASMERILDFVIVNQEKKSSETRKTNMIPSCVTPTSNCETDSLLDSKLSPIYAREKDSFLNDNRFTFGPADENLWLLQVPLQTIGGISGRNGILFEI